MQHKKQDISRQSSTRYQAQTEELAPHSQDVRQLCKNQKVSQLLFNLSQPASSCPRVQNKFSRKYKLNIAKLQGKKVKLAPNVFNVTIGELMQNSDKVQLLNELRFLKEKYNTLRRQKNIGNIPRQICGKIVNTSLKNHRNPQSLEVFPENNQKKLLIKKPLQKPQSLEHSQHKKYEKGTPRSLYELKFDKQFRERMLKHMMISQLPKPPSAFDSEQDMRLKAKIVFQLFGHNIQAIETKTYGKIQLSIRKHKNCVEFRLDAFRTIVWYFDGKFYFGGWETNDKGEAVRNGVGFEYNLQGVYQGQFVDGKKKGRGIYYHILPGGSLKNIGCIYEGQWAEGLRQGQGRQFESDGEQYIGLWEKNLRHGKGINKTKHSFYEGNFVKGIKQGYGEEYFTNGDYYAGNYKGGNYDGTGSYFWKNGSSYIGQFVSGNRQGEGKWWSHKERQEGISTYQGSYQENMKNGQGTYRWANGVAYKGGFKNDREHGQGTISYPSGKTFKCLWANGKAVKKLYSEEQEEYRRRKSQKKKEQMEQKARKTFTSKQISEMTTRW